MSGRGPWSVEENEAIVADYFAMLAAELGGLPFNKAEHNRRLRLLVNNRSEQSVEFKHANISAVLALRGYPYIDGYKPRGNFQRDLESVVLQFLDGHRDFFDSLIAGPLLSPKAEPRKEWIDPTSIIEDPPERINLATPVWSQTARLARIDFVARDAANRELGRRGEEFVLEFERRRLYDIERQPELAKRIEWTAREWGDGAGYDIASFNGDGTRRLIEVKTTGLGKYFPFCVTANEVRCSDAMPMQFHLYRVFRFGERPRLYTLPGALGISCHLDPTQYRASTKSV